MHRLLLLQELQESNWAAARRKYLALLEFLRLFLRYFIFGIQLECVLEFFLRIFRVAFGFIQTAQPGVRRRWRRVSVPFRSPPRILLQQTLGFFQFLFLQNQPHAAVILAFGDIFFVSVSSSLS